jgi:hypothetical protein
MYNTYNTIQGQVPTISGLKYETASAENINLRKRKILQTRNTKNLMTKLRQENFQV